MYNILSIQNKKVCLNSIELLLIIEFRVGRVNCIIYSNKSMIVIYNVVYNIMHIIILMYITQFT